LSRQGCEQGVAGLYSAADPAIRSGVAPGAKVCPYCGRLNGASDERCSACERPLPAPAEPSALRALGAAPATVCASVLAVLVYLALIAGDGVAAPMTWGRAVRWGALAGNLGPAQPWRYLSAMFVHFGLLHIGFNLLTLISFGRTLERLLGPARFTVLLLLSGALGFMASDLWYALQPQRQITGGLSGGIFGLMGAEVGLRFANGDEGWKRAAISALGYAAVMALLPGLNVNNAAHLGGLLSGAGLAWVIHHLRGRRPERLLVRGLAVLLSLFTLVGIALARLG
jgi:rhomboid protease GluP